MKLVIIQLAITPDKSVMKSVSIDWRAEFYSRHRKKLVLLFFSPSSPEWL
jgi:hypothetical protein